jgi:3,4-dihydroxy 2-butanone 4-phosphate synthase/GTP cyclohydrolase II
VPDLDYGFKAVAAKGSGAVLYLARSQVVSLTEGMQGGERPPTSENLHTIGIGAQVLRDLGLRKIELVSRRQLPVRGVSGFGIDVVRILDPTSLAEHGDGAWLTH